MFAKRSIVRQPVAETGAVPGMKGPRFRYKLRSLWLSVMVAGLLLGAAELYRRSRPSRTPPRLPARLPPPPIKQSGPPTVAGPLWMKSTTGASGAPGKPPPPIFPTEPPLPLPWVPASPTMTAGSRLWVNLNDVRAGVKPPGTKRVSLQADGSWRIQDARGELPDDWNPRYRGSRRGGAIND